MSEEKLRLTCLLWPDDSDNPDERTVEVEIDINRTVSVLKDLIKDKHPLTLAHVEARHLALWKCSIPLDLNVKETLNTIRFDGNDPTIHRIKPNGSQISKYFQTTLPIETIHILVEVPALGESGICIFFSATKV
jgi:hypothetical protein